MRCEKLKMVNIDPPRTGMFICQELSNQEKQVPLWYRTILPSSAEV